MAERLFEWLFKYRPLLYERGDLAFSTPPRWVLVLGATLACAATLTYLFARGRSGGVDRAVLAGLRIGLLALLLLLLARPVLLISTVVPQENYLGILVDDSRSMRIDDGESRAGFLQATVLDPTSELRESLSERFRLRVYRFSDVAERLVSDTLDYAGDRTRLGRALDHVRDELASLPVSGLVVVSDGADHSPGELDDALLRLQSARVPVFTVGVGSESFRRDIEVTRVTVPREALAGSAVAADVVLEHTGYDGRTVTVLAESEGRIVGTRDVRLGSDGSVTVQLDVTLDRPGPAVVRFRVPAEDGELVDRNNEREATLTVRDGPEKVLYFEGEPRHEVAFLRRAVAADSSLQVVVLQRSDDDRYLRLDVDAGDELAGGFPRSREELFSYRGLILGSIEASHFTHDQLEMIEEFVADRGGGLLMLGGRNAFAEGGWAGTPVAEALPVRLDRSLAADSLFHTELDVAVTREGRTHPMTRMPDSLVTPWEELPPLTAFNRLGPVKPGAVTLLSGTGAGIGNGQPVLAQQRYGRGRAAVFAVQDSWMWQMHADIPLEDETHERLWRQLVRWLVAGSPDAVVATAPAGNVVAGEPVELAGEVRDDRYGPVNHASVTAVVVAPSGARAEVPLEWGVGRDGEYRGRFVPREDGLHEVSVEARYDSVAVSTRTTGLQVGPSMEEYFGARMRRGLLERVAAETGGRFYAGGEVSNLPEDIAYTARGVTVVEENELWDMPAAFLAILVLLSAEWVYRRRRGLA